MGTRGLVHVCCAQVHGIWLAGWHKGGEELRNLATEQLKELRKGAKAKGVWLEHRTKGKLADATRTYWLVDDKGLAASLPAKLPVSLPAKLPDEPTSVADPNKIVEPCKNTQHGCTFVGSSNNSLNAHARF